jgi:hypothetical protein
MQSSCHFAPGLSAAQPFESVKFSSQKRGAFPGDARRMKELAPIAGEGMDSKRINLISPISRKYLFGPNCRMHCIENGRAGL